MTGEQFAFYKQQAGLIDAGAPLIGCNEGWTAPVAVYDAVSGFGEETWLSAQPDTVLALRLRGAPVVCHTMPGRGRRSGQQSNVALQPKGSRNAFTSSSRVAFAQIFLPDRLVDRVAHELGRASLSAMLRDDLVFVGDHRLESLCIDYVERSRSRSEAPTLLEMEAKSLLLVERILTRHHAVDQRCERGGLAPWQLRQAIDYLQESLADDVALGDLSRLVGLSTFHVCRAFKTSTGLPPHRWRHQRRIERARELLETTDLPITEIAAAIGYDDPSQLSAAFRKLVGTTPSQYRRANRS